MKRKIFSVLLALVLSAVVAVPAMAVTQTWYLTDITSGSNRVMNRGSTAGGSTPISIAKGTNVVWQANEAATMNVYFPAGNWTGNLHHTGANLVNPTSVNIGVWNSSNFTSYGSASTSMSGGATWSFTISASAFTVATGQYLALKVSNGSGQNRTLIVATDGTSFVNSMITDQGYPSPWESYNDATHTVQDDLFDSSGDIVYMYKGAGFQASNNYAVTYYDGSVTGGGQKVATDSGLIAGASGNLSSQYLLNTDINAAAGTWHAVAFDEDLLPIQGPPTNYNDAAATSGYVVADSFEVTVAAIPEFTTVIAAIVVAGLCFLIYYWMRQRSLAYAKA